MRIVIDIPEEIYNHTQEYEVGGFSQENDTKLFMAIKNGTPLPKGHGRLIDADELKKDNEEYIIQCPVRSEDDRQNKMVEWINEDITNAPTIIEGVRANEKNKTVFS